MEKLEVPTETLKLSLTSVQVLSYIQDWQQPNLQLPFLLI